MNMERKSCTPQIKRVGAGQATVVIATLGVKDKDGDVILPGFFGEQVASLKPAHNWASYDIGKARIYESGHEALADIKFYLGTDEGRNWHASIKHDYEDPPALQEYSFGFRVYEGGSRAGDFAGERVRFLTPLEDGRPGAKVREVSPVTIGAGEMTRTLVIKSWEPSEEEKQEGFRIQSLIFPKSKWDSAEAVRSWCRSHDFSSELDETESSWLARQEEPGRFARLRTICINPSREASSEECRVQAVGGPMKESRSETREDSDVAPQETPPALVHADSLPPIEDYKEYPEDRRPPLPVLTQWLRLYRYHIPFLRDIRKRDGKEISPDTIAEFGALTQEMLEVARQLNIKVMTTSLLPDYEAEARLREHYQNRHHELTTVVNTDTDQRLQRLQGEAQELERRARARAAQMRELFPS